jgi:hypothetical protein
MTHYVIYYPIFCLLLIDKARAKDLLPLDIELVIDESVDEKEEEPEAYREREKERERKKKTERKQCFFLFFERKKELPPK